MFFCVDLLIFMIEREEWAFFYFFVNLLMGLGPLYKTNNYV